MKEKMFSYVLCNEITRYVFSSNSSDFFRFISGAHLQHGGGNRVCRVRIVHSYRNASVSARAIHMFAWPDDSTLAYIVLHVNTVLLRTFVLLDGCMFLKSGQCLALWLCRKTPEKAWVRRPVETGQRISSSSESTLVLTSQCQFHTRVHGSH